MQARQLSMPTHRLTENAILLPFLIFIFISKIKVVFFVLKTFREISLFYCSSFMELCTARYKELWCFTTFKSKLKTFPNKRTFK